MAKKPISIGVRISGKLQKRIEAIAEREAGKGHFAMKPNMSELARQLLALGVDAYEQRASMYERTKDETAPSSSPRRVKPTTSPQENGAPS